MEKFDGDLLSEPIVKEILSFKEEKLRSIQKCGTVLNLIIREDIFPLLDKYCTVVYYPKVDSKNNGFHRSYTFQGQNIHFVYINTAQYKEKQIFTAAHELGHIWKLDEYLESRLNLTITPELGEKIMNRFAAELLIPKEIFLPLANAAIDSMGGMNEITVRGMLYVIVAMMNEFFVPYKSIVHRLYELEIISLGAARILWGEYPSISEETLEENAKKIAKEQSFSRLYKDDGRKWINNLKELLDQARDTNKMPTDWLQAFYRRFDLDFDKPDKTLDSPLPTSSTEGEVKNV